MKLTIKIFVIIIIISTTYSCKNTNLKTKGLYIYKSHSIDYEYKPIKVFYALRFFDKNEGAIATLSYTDTVNYTIDTKMISNWFNINYKKTKPEVFFKYEIENDSIFFNDNQFLPTIPIKYSGKIEDNKIIFNYKVLNPEFNYDGIQELVDTSTTRIFTFYPNK